MQSKAGCAERPSRPARQTNRPPVIFISRRRPQRSRKAGLTASNTHKATNARYCRCLHGSAQSSSSSSPSSSSRFVFFEVVVLFVLIIEVIVVLVFEIFILVEIVFVFFLVLFVEVVFVLVSDFDVVFQLVEAQIVGVAAAQDSTPMNP